jgi:hypothetical protein
VFAQEIPKIQGQALVFAAATLLIRIHNLLSAYVPHMVHFLGGQEVQIPGRHSGSI